jgi:sugar O-acyltransferase (sialic acid O-acetyltransferase NeuD family)
VAEIAELAGWQEIVFFDKAFEKIKSNGIWPVTGDLEALLAQKDNFDAAIVAIGNNHIRCDRSDVLSKAGFSLISLIHPSAVISHHASIGAGTVIMANAVVNPFSVISDNVIINTAAIIEHDCIIKEGVHICPAVSLAGEVDVAEKAWIGIGSSVKQQCQIGAGSVIGAGAAVISDIPAGVIVCGVPAKIIKSV